MNKNLLFKNAPKSSFVIDGESNFFLLRQLLVFAATDNENDFDKIMNLNLNLMTECNIIDVLEPTEIKDGNRNDVCVALVEDNNYSDFLSLSLTYMSDKYAKKVAQKIIENPEFYEKIKEYITTYWIIENNMIKNLLKNNLHETFDILDNAKLIDDSKINKIVLYRNYKELQHVGRNIVEYEKDIILKDLGKMLKGEVLNGQDYSRQISENLSALIYDMKNYSYEDKSIVKNNMIEFLYQNNNIKKVAIDLMSYGFMQPHTTYDPRTNEIDTNFGIVATDIFKLTQEDLENIYATRAQELKEKLDVKLPKKERTLKI